MKIIANKPHGFYDLVNPGLLDINSLYSDIKYTSEYNGETVPGLEPEKLTGSRDISWMNIYSSVAVVDAMAGYQDLCQKFESTYDYKGPPLSMVYAYHKDGHRPIEDFMSYIEHVKPVLEMNRDVNWLKDRLIREVNATDHNILVLSGSSSRNTSVSSSWDWDLLVICDNMYFLDDFFLFLHR